MGNSPAIVNRHYRQLTTPAVAKKWFETFPPKSAKSQPAVSTTAAPAQLQTDSPKFEVAQQVVAALVQTCSHHLTAAPSLKRIKL
jgi:hypothetical protein